MDRLAEKLKNLMVKNFCANRDGSKAKEAKATPKEEVKNKKEEVRKLYKGIENTKKLKRFCRLNMVIRDFYIMVP